MKSTTPATIRAALALTNGNYLLTDGRNANDGATFFAADLDAKIGDKIGEYITRWDSDADVLELAFA